MKVTKDIMPSGYDVPDFEILGSSYIGEAKDNTVMFIAKKVEHLLINLKGHKNCLVFVENGIDVPEQLSKDNYFIFTDKPQYEYAKFANELNKQNNLNGSYTLTSEGYYIGDNVVIGKNCYIEPNVLIGHNVTIGDNATILSGSIIKNAIIGDNFYCNENAVIGNNAFNVTEDTNGNKYKIPTLGKVVIHDNVEVGALCDIAAGMCGDTILEDNAKIDSLVHVGHEAHLHGNVEVTAGVVIGGFVDIGEYAYIGINSTLRNRIKIGDRAFVGMGSNVTKSVEEGIVVAGNPAKPFIK